MTRDEYVGEVTPALQRLKFAYWGHDQVVFHEREIRMKIGPFAMLADPATNADFMADSHGDDRRGPIPPLRRDHRQAQAQGEVREPGEPYEIALRFLP